MKLGFLHVRGQKPPESGVTRYGRILAQEASQRSDLSILEADLSLSGAAQEDFQSARQCGLSLSGVDLFHVQFSPYLWGIGRTGAKLLRELKRTVNSPMVVTFHDLRSHAYPEQHAMALFKECFRDVRKSGGGLCWSLWRGFREVQNGCLRDRRDLRWITRNSAVVIVCTAEERQRLINLSHGSPVAVIPHFVERRQPQLTPQTAKMTVGLEKYNVVLLAGFIFPSKGYEVALEALKLLPAEYFLVFAGRASVGQDSYVHSLRQQARLLGVESRLHITGGLSDFDMETYLLAADVAICPFMQMSASGSFSTWLSVGTAPIIASDLPQIQWYNAMVPGAITVFPAGDAQALAVLISNADADSGRAARLKLRDLLSVTRIVDEHLGLYRNLLAHRTPGSRSPVAATVGTSSPWQEDG